MNNIDIRSASESALVLESLGVVTLGSFWNRITLSGDYWRFYHHTGSGAGVIVRGRKKLFAPGCCYLLPPACNLESCCSGTPEQLFIHAELTGCQVAFTDEIIELPEKLADERVDFLRKQILSGAAGTMPVRLTALALMADALACLPKAVLEPPAQDQRIRNVRDFINTHLEEDISLDELARRTGMSATAFLRFFKRECGITPYQYILQQRYNCAAKLLKNSNLTVEAICDAVGIKDRFHFSRQFKRLFGMPPAAYRSCYRQTQ